VTEPEPAPINPPVDTQPAPEPEPEPVPARPTEPAPAPTEPPPATFVYIVQQGETLWGIAKKFGTTVDAIVALNNIEDRNKIRAGQKLLIPR
jgi:LysM repeat protein